MIDDKINLMLDELLHAKAFQQLEASWRGLWYLVNNYKRTTTNQVLIKLLNINPKELSKDLAGAIEFDQSVLFKLIYTQELDHAGGEPFGLIIGDYYFCHKPTNTFPDSISTLKNLAQICSQAFTPFISGIHPHHFGIDHYGELKPDLDLYSLFTQREYARWLQLQDNKDTRFIGLTLSRILARTPYNKNNRYKIKTKTYTEQISNHTDYLWMNPCYSYATTVINSFTETGWLANIYGSQESGGGNIKVHREFLSTDMNQNCGELAAELLITDGQEKQLSDLGYLPLQDCPISQKAVFNSTQSLYIARQQKNIIYNANILINTKLHYVLCAARFSHYIKIIMREKIGRFTNKSDCEQYLNNWLKQYCAATDNQSEIIKAKYPLNNANVKIHELAAQPGHYRCEINISPHYQLDKIDSHLHFITKIRL